MEDPLVVHKRLLADYERVCAENDKLKEENDHLDNVIQGLHHDLDVLRKLVEI